MAEAPKVGTVVWQDLTVPAAERVRDFYAAVVGWRPEPVEMGGYSDFNMVAPGTDQPAAGICFARGANARLPPQWLIYVTVADLDASLEACAERGGVVVDGPRGMGEQRFAVVRDPAGAHVGLLGPKA
jgi:predicted enzyme related to lactoylglutathione lyase